MMMLDVSNNTVTVDLRALDAPSRRVASFSAARGES